MSIHSPKPPIPSPSEKDLNLQDIPLDSLTNPPSNNQPIENGSISLAIDYGQESFWTRMGCTFRSFQQRNRDGDPQGAELNHKMKPRHLQMIAIGGSIGAGFFVGSGSALNHGGPGTLVIVFCIMGLMIFNVVYALGELAVMFPVTGGFYIYASRFIDPSWGFAMGWNYVLQWAIVLPLELVVAGVTMGYWPLAREVNVGVWIALFLGLIILINILGALGYAESEFIFSVIKLVAVVLFMVIGLVCVLGGGPKGGKYDHYYGARLWYDPGAFKNGFRGFCSVFVTAAFSFSGTELVGLAAAEAKNPATALPGAVKQVFWRITLFYVIGMLLIGLLVSSNDPRLLGSGNQQADSVNVAASPFVIFAKDALLKGLDSILNIVILVSVISIGNSGVYGGSRTLHALATQGYAPKFFTYVDRAGRPLPATVAVLMVGLLGFLNESASGLVIFDWLIALSGLAALFTWGSICLAHIRFREAWALKGHTVDEIPFKAVGGVWGSWLGLGLVSAVLVAQFYTALFPLENNGKICSPAEFFKAYMAFPIALAFWLGGYLWKRKGWLSTEEIDVDTGRREPDWVGIRERKEMIASFGVAKRVYYFLF